MLCLKSRVESRGLSLPWLQIIDVKNISDLHMQKSLPNINPQALFCWYQVLNFNLQIWSESTLPLVHHTLHDKYGESHNINSSFVFCGYFAAGGKRKHDEKRDNQVSKHIHLDPESTDGFAELTTLVNMSSAAPLSVSQVAFFK